MVQTQKPKRLVVCLDGTWNKVADRGEVTNVVRIRDALSPGIDASGAVQQFVYYDEGVGTGDGPIDKFVGGAFGVGLSRNIRQAYKYLCRYYEPGDDIHLIGFSRGAFTARSLAGMIGACGLLHKDACTTENEDLVWSYYHTDRKDRTPGDEAKWRDISYGEVPIKCVAVFDTVGALGIPDRYFNWIFHSRFSFHDTRIGTAIQNAFQALAIDERRRPFSPTLWERPFNQQKLPNVEQVWFSGVHGDVGGGYSERTLSTTTLDWMVSKLESVGLEFDDTKLPYADLVRSAPIGVVHESRTFYLLDWLLPYTRPITKLSHFRSARGDDEQLQYDPLNEFVHCSALERAASVPNYRPHNLGAVLHLIEIGFLGVVGWDGKPMERGAAQASLAKIKDWREWSIRDQPRDCSSPARRRAFALPSRSS